MAICDRYIRQGIWDKFGVSPFQVCALSSPDVHVHLPAGYKNPNQGGGGDVIE